MKRTVFTGIMIMLILSTAVTAQAAHTHKYTKQNSKVYVCECGKEKPLYSLKGRIKLNFRCRIKAATISLRGGLPKAAKRYRLIPSIIPTQHSMHIGA